MMRWGLIPYWAKEQSSGLRTINAKAETITPAPAFREAIKYRRCLVPVLVERKLRRLEWKKKSRSQKTKLNFDL
jgi:putative SOS response-associated peptidase YedK